MGYVVRKFHIWLMLFTIILLFLLLSISTKYGLTKERDVAALERDLVTVTTKEQQEASLFKSYAKNQVSIYANWWKIGCEDSMDSVVMEIGDSNPNMTLELMTYKSKCKNRAEEIENELKSTLDRVKPIPPDDQNGEND